MAWAQSSEVKVTDLNDLSDEKYYFIESQRAFLMYNTSANATGLSTSTSTAVQVSRTLTNYNYWFSIKTIGGNRYLYSIGAGKYITKDGTFSDTPVDALGIKPAKSENRVDTNNYNWMLTIGGNGLNSQDPGQTSSGILVNGWTHNDPGNCYRIIDVESVLPFELCSSYDEITNWYKLGIRDDNLGPSFLKYDAKKQYIPTPSSYNESEKEAFAWAFVVTPGTGISIVNKAAGATKVLSAPEAPTGDKNSAQLARMVEKNGATGNIVWDIIIPTTHGSTKEFSFYVQHPTAKNYAFNRQYYNNIENALCYWTGRDTGSSIWTEGIQGDAVVLKNLVSELNALFASKPKGDAVGQYSSSYANYESEFNRISGYASTLADNAIGADIRKDIAVLNAIKESYSINMPKAEKYYTFSNDGKYITGNVSNDRIACGANNDAYAIYYFDGSRLKSYTNGLYIGLNNTDWTFSENGSAIEFVAAVNGAAGKFNIKSGSGNNGRWLHLTVNTDGTAFVNRCSNNTCGNDHNWVIEEVTQLPVAQSGNIVYYSLADAKDNVKAGETLTLFVDTDETIEFPFGVTLDKNGHTANNLTVATPVAKIGEQGYATLAAAVNAASAGAKITFVKNINENVTLSKNVTIDGAGKQYTGTMSANNALTVTVQNVHFVNGGFSKNNDGTSGTYTIKDCTFDGQGKYAYPVLAKSIGTLNVENCTVKNYQYGFLYVKKQSTKVSVKSVTVDGCANYAVYFASGVAATIEDLTVKNSNNGILWTSAGARTLNLKNCKFEGVKTAINSNGGAYVVTANVQGVNNDFGTAVLSDNVKCVLVEDDATLAATTAGLNVTTDVEGKVVAYKEGVYSVVEANKAYTDAITASNAEVTATAENEVTVKYTGDVKFVDNANGVGSNWISFIITKPAKVDATKAMVKIPSGSSYKEVTLASVLDAGKDYATMWTSCQFKKAFQYEIDWNGEGNYDLIVKIDATEATPQVPVAKVGKTYYSDFAEAYAAAQAGQTVTLYADLEMSEILVLDKAITLDGNGKTLTSTATRAINIETEGNVGIKNLTIDAKGERAINVINKPANVTIEKVTAVAENNAVMIATSAGAAKVTIDGCDFTGLAVVNVAGAGAQVAINDTKITNVDASKAENYGAITVYSTATNAKVTVTGGSITVADDSKKAYIFAEGATVTGVDQIGQIVAMIGDAGYETLTEAIADAKEGQTVKMVYDVTLSEILVINKAITLDGNGKKLTSTATGSEARAINVSGADGVTIKNLTIDAKGQRAINVIQNATNVIIDGVTATAANYTVNVAGSAANAVVAIKNSTLNGLCTVNVAAAGAKVTVDNSTVNCNDNNTTVGESYAALSLNKEAVGGSIVATNTTINVTEGSDSMKGRNGAENGTVTIDNSTDGVAVMVAAITYEGTDNYHAFATLKAAVEFAQAGQTVTLLRDVTGAGVVIDKDITIDFNGKTYTVNQTVGSTGTTTLGLQILKDNAVTLKNGTLKSTGVVEGKQVKMLVQNYANLTVDNMKLVDETEHIQYVLSNNSGTVNIVNGSVISSDAVALDACQYASYAKPTVTVAEGVTVNGKVEVSATLNMNGTLDGTIVINGTEGRVNGAEGLNVTAMDGYKVAYDGSAYTIVEKQYVAQVGEDKKYETFAEAVAAAPAGGTVTLIADATEDATVVLTKNLTIDGAGKTFTGAIEFEKSNGFFTIKNVNFNGAGTRVYALKSQSSTTDLTVENCEATDYTYGFLYANKAIANLTVKNVTVEEVNYGVHSARGTKITLENYKATNVKYPVYVQNYSGRNVVLNNCTFKGCEYPLSIWERNQTYKVTFNFEGVNDMGKAEFCTDAMAVVNADAIVGTKVYTTLAAAVEAANAGDDVTLLRNVQLDALLTIDKSITLNLGKYNITRDARTALYVEGDDVEVTINGKGTVSGKQALYVGGGLVKVYGGNFHGLTEAVYVQHSGKAEIYGGTFSSDNVDFVLNEYDSTRETSDIIVYGGTFVGFNPADNAAEGQGTNFVAAGYVVDNVDGTYTVKENPAYGKVAKVGEEYYETLAAAVKAAPASGTVTLIADAVESKTVVIAKALTIDGAGHKFTGAIEFDKSNASYTIKNVKFYGADTRVYALKTTSSTATLTVEDCEATGYTYGFLYANKSTTNVIVNNVTVENVNYGVHSAYGTNVTLNEFVANNVEYGVMVQNYSGRNVVLNNCSFTDCQTPLYVWERNRTYKVKFDFQGVNEMGKADFCTSAMAVVNADAIVGTKVYATLAAAVEAANAGDAVTLLRNVELSTYLTINKSITLNLGEYNITRDGGTALYVNGDVVVDINGTTGTVTGDQALFVNNGLVKVNGGHFYGTSSNAEAVYVKGNGEVEIYGGTFEGDTNAQYYYVLNKLDADRATSSITVYGGTFVGFNPENNAAEGKGTNFVAAGYAASHNVADNSWTVGKAIAQVGEQKYASLQAAIDAAQDGDIVTLLADLNLGWDDIVLSNDNRNVLAYVHDKSITLNMNRKTIAVDHQGTEENERIFAVVLVEDGASLTVTGNGTIDVDADDNTPKVAYMFWKRGTAGYLVIKNGNFHMDNSEDSMVYANSSNTVTVQGGTFVLDAFGTRVNGFPWIFNAASNNANYIYVEGGSYNYDIRNQHWSKEVRLAEGKTMIETENGLWTVAEAEAAIDGRGYLTLAAAVEAAQDGKTVTLLKDVTGAGLVINKSITINFGGHTYTVNKAVGSKGTETLGLQILKGNDVTLTNGTLTSTKAVEGSKEIKMLVQNYANLTVDNMQLVDDTDVIQYVLSNNSGETLLTGNTNITTNAVAFDSYYSKYYNAPTVYVETEGRIEGAIEKNDGATIAISSGTFTAEILPEWCAEYYAPVQNADGTWTVESRYINEWAIVDNGKYTYDFVNDMTVGEFTYTRTFPAVNLWQTAYFPFEIPVEVLVNKGYEVGYFYDIHFEFNDGEINMQNNPDLHIMKVKSGTLRANYPYVIKPTAEADLNLVLEFENIVLHSVNDMKTVESSSTVHTFEFAGLYKGTSCSDFAGDAPCYTITTKGEFKKIAKTVSSLPSLRVYMTIKAKDGEPVIFNETNAPEYIRMRVIGEENEDGTTTIYDVNAEEAEEMIFDLSGRRVLETEKGIYIKNGKKVLVK